jgi:hypothetical protein
MELVYFSHKSKNNLDCIELWEYINSKGGVLYEELESVFNNERWKQERKRHGSFCSNLVYCIRKLKEKGALEVVANRESGGRFDYSMISSLKMPVIKREALKEPDLPKCVDCSREFKRKRPDAKYKDLCHDCTKTRFMLSAEIHCAYCNIVGPRNKMKAFIGGTYHKECLVTLKAERRKATSEKRKVKRICKECNVVELESKTRKYCEDCKLLRRARERELLLIESGKSDRKCIICESDMTGRGGVKFCRNNSCAAIFYAKENSNFSGRKGDSDSSSNVIKRKIIGSSCIVCEYSTIIHYHHVVERSKGGLDVLNNFVPLCPNHHAEVHHRGLDIEEYHDKVLQRIEDVKNGSTIID